VNVSANTKDIFFCFVFKFKQWQLLLIHMHSGNSVYLTESLMHCYSHELYQVELFIGELKLKVLYTMFQKAMLFLFFE